ncbi:MAG TPA: hypothetical protein VJJ47_01915 [Candidatus Paceibacterota bacterium]
MDIGQAAGANIIRELGIEALPPDEQREAVDRAGALVFGAVVLRVMEQLGEADRKKLGELFAAETTTGDELLAFLSPLVPNLDAIVAEEVGKFKSEAVDFLDAVAKEG